MSRPAFYAVDASIYIFRAYFSLPPRWHADNGYETQALYGYAAFLLRLLEEERPLRLACAFDESLGTGFRHRLWPAYKANRALPDEPLAYQLACCRELTTLLGVTTLASSEFEADDLIASLAVLARRHDYRVIVLSRDKDLGQVLGTANDTLWDYPDGKPLDREALRRRFGVVPEKLAELQALTGDPVDAIPGVPGVGTRTAARLLERFRTLQNLLDNLDAVAACGLRGGRKLTERLKANSEQVPLNLQLTRLREDALAEHFELPLWDPASIDYQRLEHFLDSNGIASLGARCRRLCELTG